VQSSKLNFVVDFLANVPRRCFILSPRVNHPGTSFLLAIGLAAAINAHGLRPTFQRVEATRYMQPALRAGKSSPPSPADGPAVAAGGLELTSCQLEDPVRVSVVGAECGDLSVLENPAEPTGRRIKLRVARVAAISRRKQPDPLFVLAGGPGMAATTFYASAAFAFERIHRDRDIVLVDQRGTGQSNSLNCKLDDDELYHAGSSEVVAETRHCLTSLEKTADVRFYTTSIAVKDLDQVREALGYERINLYGVSYGTRVAQHYLRRYPSRTRALILDGVVAPQTVLGPETSLDAEQALTHILGRCIADRECHEHFGDPSLAYHKLRDTLQAHAASVSLPDPTSGAALKFDFTGYHLANVLRLASYTAEQAALLPLMLHSATDSNDFVPLASQFLLVSRSYGDVLSYGMHNSVVCSEDVPFYDLAKINRAELEKTYLGTAQLDGLRDICSAWPQGPVDADFHAPLRTAVPVLLLSGSDDPITPPADAELARHELTHSVHVILQGFGHGQITAPCIDRVMANFMARGAVEGLDVSCARNDKPLPFFISTGGPAP
jgi:pimeloyl-ACP methyl ester carboxylesterase